MNVLLIAVVALLLFFLVARQGGGGEGNGGDGGTQWSVSTLALNFGTNQTAYIAVRAALLILHMPYHIGNVDVVAYKTCRQTIENEIHRGIGLKMLTPVGTPPASTAVGSILESLHFIAHGGIDYKVCEGWNPCECWKDLT